MTATVLLHPEGKEAGDEVNRQPMHLHYQKERHEAPHGLSNGDKCGAPLAQRIAHSRALHTVCLHRLCCHCKHAADTRVPLSLPPNT
jgi:hypothetical protein